MNLNTRVPLLPLSPGKTGWPWTHTPQNTQAVTTEGRHWPKISIVTPSFNQGQFLEETIRSVLLQGYPNLEYIIIDGGSTDNSLEIIKRYEPWLSYWVSERDQGQTEALNKGFASASGEWMAWLNSDDIYLPGTLMKIARIIINNPAIHWLVGTTVLADAKLSEQGRSVPLSNSGPWTDYICMRQLGINLPQPSRSGRGRHGRQQAPSIQSFRYAMDQEYWGRLAPKGFLPFA